MAILKYFPFIFKRQKTNGIYSQRVIRRLHRFWEFGLVAEVGYMVRKLIFLKISQKKLSM
jgi:hypothetical protein